MKVGVAGLSARQARGVRRSLEDAHATVAWVADDPEALARHCQSDRPDAFVVSTGWSFDALETGSLRASDRVSTTQRPCAILVVVDDPAASVDDAYAALERGAAAVARAPWVRVDGSLEDPDRIATLLQRLTHEPRATGSAHAVEVASTPIVIVAASTGGPHALARVLASLPRAPLSRVLLAQHIDATFTPGLATWLSAESGREVELAGDGAALSTSRALLVRADQQPTLDRSGRVRYQPFTDADLHRPSIDRLFESALVLHTLGSVALLTGMGDDGARGMLRLRERGWRTIAQDRATSVVFGMPGAALALGAAEQSLPLEEIGPALLRAARRAS